MIPFNKPFLTGKETVYIEEAVHSGKISGNGMFTAKCQQFFEDKYGSKKCLLTTSCTDALEMCALLLDIQPDDEVIVPSYTFVSTALAFVRQGAKIVFADSRHDHPGIDENKIDELVTSKTKVIIVVHYTGVACDMEKILDIAERYNLFIVEDAAQAIDSFYLGKDGIKRALGSIGHLATFSFHETKNIQCGEGGLLVVNDERFIKRAEIIWEKGTNRAQFFRGEIDKYGWIDIGSSFLPSEISAAFLYAQIENLEKIQMERVKIWNFYYKHLKPLADKGQFHLPITPEYATNNAHMFYLVCNSLEDRTKLISHLKNLGIMAIFHYQSLHKSLYYKEKHDGRELANSDHYSDCLVRLPMFVELEESDLNKIIASINTFYDK